MFSQKSYAKMFCATKNVATKRIDENKFVFIIVVFLKFQNIVAKIEKINHNVKIFPLKKRDRLASWDRYVAKYRD